jgi:hypothetical protein
VVTEGPETVGLTPVVSPDTTTSPPGSDSSSPSTAPGPDDASLAACLGVPSAGLNDRTLDEATGVTFRDDAATIVVTSRAEVVTPQSARTFMSMLASPNLVKCSQDTGSSDGVDSVTEAPVSEGALAAIRMSGKNSDGLQSVVDLIFVGRGQVICILAVDAVDGGLPSADLESRLVPQLLRKLQHQ